MKRKISLDTLGKVLDKRTFHGISDGEKTVFTAEDDCFSCEITLDGAAVSGDVIFGNTFEPGGGSVSYIDADDGRKVPDIKKAEYTGISGSVEIFDLYSGETGDGTEKVVACGENTHRIASLFGTEVLNADDLMIRSAATAMFLLSSPESSTYLRDEDYVEAEEFLSRYDVDTSRAIGEYAASRHGSGEIRSAEKMKKILRQKRELLDGICRDLSPICAAANGEREPSPSYPAEAMKTAIAAADRAAEKAGFSGKYPTYRKGDGEVAFSASYRPFSADKRNFRSDIGVKIKTAKKRFIGRERANDVLPLFICENIMTGGDPDEEMETLFDVTDSIIEGREPDGKKLASICDPGNFDRSADTLLAVFGIILSAFGILMSLGVLFFTAKNVGSKIFASVSLVAFAALGAASVYFGPYLKKHPKYLVKIPKKERDQNN